MIDVKKDSYSEDSRIEKINNQLSLARKHLNEWRTRADEEEEFYAGDQWSEEDKQKLLTEGRPVITFNKIVKIINAVAGIEIQNKQEIKYSPTEPTDVKFADALNEAVKFVVSQCDGEDEESEAFQDALKLGIGWMETSISYDEDLDGKISMEARSPHEIIYDSYAVRKNLKDTRWRARIHSISEDEWEEKWPDKSPERGSFWSDELEASSVHNFPGDAYKRGNSGFDIQNPQNIYIVQYQYFELETVYRFTDIDGELKTVTRPQWKKIKKGIEDLGIRWVEQKRKKFKQIFINGQQILEEGDCPINNWTLLPITGLRDKKRNYWFGLLRLLMDPQRWSNKWLSQILHIINSNATGGLLAEPAAFMDPSKAKAEWSNPASITEMTSGGLNKIMPKPSPQYPQGIETLMHYSNQSMMETTGLNEEVLGMANRDQPGILEIQRLKTVYTTFSVFFNSLRLYRKEQGRVLAEFVKEYYTDGKIIRILGESGPEFVKLLKDDFSFKYDVIVDESAKSPNSKDRTFGVLEQILPAFMQMGIAPPIEALDYLPLPQSLITKWKESLQKEPEPDPMEQRMKEMEMMMSELMLEREKIKNENTQSQTELNYAKAAKEDAMAVDYNARAETEDSSEARKDAEFVAKERRARLENIIELQKPIMEGINDINTQFMWE
jgi:hypothetical protein